MHAHVLLLSPQSAMLVKTVQEVGLPEMIEITDSHARILDALEKRMLEMLNLRHLH